MLAPLQALAPFRRRAGIRLDRWFVLVLMSAVTAAIDWRIGETWHWPAASIATWLAGTLLLCAVLARLGRGELAAGAAAALLYSVPVVAAVVRWHQHPGSLALIGDGALQTAIAGNLVLHGIDPYGYDYSHTLLARAPWGQAFPNPALHHLVYWPGTMLLPLPLQAAAQALFGFWDERLFLLGAAVATFWLIRLLLGGPAGWAAAAVLFLVPGHAFYAILGDNDMPMLALLLGSLVAARRRAFPLAGLLLGLAVVTKQTALVAAPLVVAWILAQNPDRRSRRWCAVAGAASIALMVPFVVWNPGAFWADTVRYNLGSGPQAYPIQGIGVGSLLLHLGLIHGPRDAFPFAALQAAVVIPIWVAGWRWIQAHRDGRALLLTWLAVAFFGLLACNRFFQPTYLLLSVELALAGLYGLTWGSPGQKRQTVPTEPAAA